jgi:7,8-dihydropterin-6-yl-methyl-4-(beta-D-ribofuranosyl)aminobenzene 5'-phosphate synthase
MFLISGEIPRVTSYETGFKNGIAFFESKKSWVKDELISDERFLMCNVKGKRVSYWTRGLFELT